MKTVRFYSTVSLFMALFLMVFSACQKDQNVITNESASPELLQISKDIATDISVENGVLIFQDLKDYRTTLLGLNRLSALEQLLWEKSIDFVSMQRLFEKIMAAEEMEAQSSIYLNALQNGLVAENEWGYDLNIFNPTYAPVLNEDGIVKVGKTIYQFTPKALKVWQNGVIEQLETLLQTTTSTTEIQVIPMEMGEVEFRTASVWADNCQQENDDTRMILSGIFYSDFENSSIPEVIFVKYYINLKSQWKDAQGLWHYDNQARIKMLGQSHSQFEISDGVDIYTKNFEQQYEIEEKSGNFYLIADESGYWEMNSPYFFTRPAELISCDWEAKNQMSLGANFYCQISK